MSLVELLVVIGILMLLMVTVAPALAPTPDQKGREAAGTVISMINRSQKRAVDQNADAGLWLEPLFTSGSVRVIPPRAFVQLDGQTMAMATLDMFACEPQDNYSGEDPGVAQAFAYPVNSSSYKFVPAFREDECLLLFEEGSCAFIRSACSQSSRVTLSPGSDGQSYYFQLLSPEDQNKLSPSYFPKPYRPCNLAPGGGQLPPSDDNFQNPNPTIDPETKFYSGFGDSLESGPAPKLIVGVIRSEDGSRPFTSNSPWLPLFDPANPVFPVSGSGGVRFAIQRPNARTATPPLSIPSGYAIDVAWSSYGTCLLHNSVDANRLGNGSKMQLIDNFLANQPVQVMFDLNGCLKHLVIRKFLPGFGAGAGSMIDETLQLNSDLFLLIGRAERVGRPYVANPADDTLGANWQYPDSWWVAIDPMTGVARSAECVPGAVDVVASQRWIREALLGSGR